MTKPARKPRRKAGGGNSVFKTVDGRIIAVSGKSRSGKSTKVGDLISNDPRVFVWDPDDQFSKIRGFKRVKDRRGLLEMAKKPGPVRVAFVAGGDLKAEFDYFCHAVWLAGWLVGPLTAVIEELADVTTPSKAPGYWGQLVRRGLKRGITIIPISQRWAEADKSALGNASEIYIFACATRSDAKYLEEKTDIDRNEIYALPNYHFIKKDVDAKTVERGKLPFA